MDNDDDEDNYHSRGLGINGRDLVKAFIGQREFSGGYHGNMKEVLNVSEELS